MSDSPQHTVLMALYGRGWIYVDGALVKDGQRVSAPSSSSRAAWGEVLELVNEIDGWSAMDSAELLNKRLRAIDNFRDAIGGLNRLEWP